MSIARESKTFLKRLVGTVSRQRVDGFSFVNVSTRVLESMTLKHVIIATLLLPEQGCSPNIFVWSWDINGVSDAFNFIGIKCCKLIAFLRGMEISLTVYGWTLFCLSNTQDYYHYLSLKLHLKIAFPCKNRKNIHSEWCSYPITLC